MRAPRRPRYYNPDLPIKQMNPEVYKQKQQIIKIIYEMKKIVPDLPRINVRVTNPSLVRPSLLGQAGMGKELIIWIPDTALTNENLRHIIYHEVLHTAFKVEHSTEDPVMSSRYVKGGAEEAVLKDRLKFYAKQAGMRTN